MTTTQRRMDTSLTAIKDAVIAAQQDLQADIGAFPHQATLTAGAVLKELDGDVRRLLSEFTRDAERPIGQALNATPQNTGLKASNIRGIRAAHSQRSDSQYQAVKRQATQSGKPLTREMVRKANPNAQPNPPSQNASKRLQQQNAQLQQRVNQLTSRVTSLENTLRAHQIPLPL